MGYLKAIKDKKHPPTPKMDIETAKSNYSMLKRASTPKKAAQVMWDWYIVENTQIHYDEWFLSRPYLWRDIDD